ncbi:MAG: hypothetical protein WCK41_02965 [Actinomycetes bacterium]
MTERYESVDPHTLEAVHRLLAEIDFASIDELIRRSEGALQVPGESDEAAMASIREPAVAHQLVPTEHRNVGALPRRA